MIFDSHAHLDDDMFILDREYVLSHLKENGVGAIINAGTNIETSETALNFAKRYKNVFAVCGFHPEELDKIAESDVPKLIELLKEPECVGMGEIGLDYHWQTPTRETQNYWFRRQLEIAEEMDIPIVVHDREAHEDTLKAIDEFNVRGVFHCFSGSKEMAKELLKKNFYISFGGVLTFKNARKTVEAAEVVPMNRVLVETDSPYLAPVPYRGKRNEPRLTKFTVQKLAELRNLSIKEVEDITFKNTCTLFNINTEAL